MGGDAGRDGGSSKGMRSDGYQKNTKGDAGRDGGNSKGMRSDGYQKCMKGGAGHSGSDFLGMYSAAYQAYTNGGGDFRDMSLDDYQKFMKGDAGRDGGTVKGMRSDGYQKCMADVAALAMSSPSPVSTSEKQGDDEISTEEESEPAEDELELRSWRDVRIDKRSSAMYFNMASPLASPQAENRRERDMRNRCD